MWAAIAAALGSLAPIVGGFFPNAQTLGAEQVAGDQLNQARLAYALKIKQLAADQQLAVIGEGERQQEMRAVTIVAIVLAGAGLSAALLLRGAR